MECVLIMNYDYVVLVNIVYVGYCSSLIIDENQSSSAPNILSMTKLKSKQQKTQPPTKIDQMAIV